MWQSLRTNDLQMVSTDHCPFCMKDQKELGLGDFSKIPNGIGSIEHRMDLMYQGVVTGELTLDLEGMQSAFQEASLQIELDAIGVLLDQARPLVGVDSKGREFLAAIKQLQGQGYRQVIVFSQYTDTVDALKQLLIGAGRTSLMCFTGRGGELLQRSGSWESLNREATKRKFKQGEAEILLCTDAAAEGLNFQFCGALINYDMPWNPMRVEQRIGRIDRIGQTHDSMQIINLHLEGTVEADVYRALRGRIAMFEQVVGKLQPILAKASSSISQATLVSRDQREKARAAAVAAVQQEPEIKGLDLDDVLQDLEAIRDVVNTLQPPPLSLADLEAILRQPETGRLFLQQGIVIAEMGPEKFAPFIQAEAQKYARIIRESGAKAE
jgi:hypothetical protein